MISICFSPYHGNSLLFEAYYGKYYVCKSVKVDLIKNINEIIAEVRSKVIMESYKEEEKIIA